jgi:hypothetical protein
MDTAVKELLASAKALKAKSRIKTNKENYLLLKVDGGFETSTISDPSFVGSLRVENSKKTVYLIFGPTEKERLLKGDHQKIVSHYGKSLKKNVRAYDLESQLQVILIIQAKLISLGDQSNLGKASKKDKKDKTVLQKNLATFAIDMQNFLFGF